MQKRKSKRTPLRTPRSTLDQEKPGREDVEKTEAVDSIFSIVSDSETFCGKLKTSKDSVSFCLDKYVASLISYVVNDAYVFNSERGWVSRIHLYRAPTDNDRGGYLYQWKAIGLNKE